MSLPVARPRRPLWHGAALALTAAVGLTVGYLTRPFLGRRISLVVAVALGGGAGTALWARISGEPRPLLHALGTARGGALGAYVGTKLFDQAGPVRAVRPLAFYRAEPDTIVLPPVPARGQGVERGGYVPGGIPASGHNA